MRLFPLLFALLFAAPAAAVEWAGNIVKTGQVASATLIAGDTADSVGYLNATCGLATVSFDADITGDNTAAAASISAVSTPSTPEASGTTYILSDGASVTIPVHRLPFLQIIDVTAPGAGDEAQIRVTCQDQFASGDTAPGVNGTTATNATLEWIGGLTTVPFPSAIDSGQWTDLYFSAEAGGDYPALGDDSNDCSSPQQPCLTVDKIRTECLTSPDPYTRCNLDVFDDWTVGGSHFPSTGLGAVADADILTDLSSCPQGAPAALEQPCIWIRSSRYQPGEQATINGDAHTTGDDFYAERRETKRHGVLWENIELIGDEDAAKGSTPFDSFDGAVLMGIGMTLSLTDNRAVNSGTANLSTCHDGSVQANYGWSPMDYGSASHTDVGAALGGQDACALSVISNAPIVGGLESGGACNILGALATPVTTFPADAALLAEIANSATYYLVAGAEMRCVDGSTYTGQNSLVKITPSRGHKDGNSDKISGRMNVALINTKLVLGNRSGYSAGGFSPYIEFNPESDTTTNLDIIGTTFANHFSQGATVVGAVPLAAMNSYCPSGDPTGGDGASDCGTEPEPKIQLTVAGSIWEGAGDTTTAWYNHTRWLDHNAFTNALDSHFALVDTVYLDKPGSTSWRFEDETQTLAFGATPAAMQTAWEASSSLTFGDYFDFTGLTASVANESSTADTGTTTTVAVWAAGGLTTNEYAGCLLVNQTGARQASRRITSNTATAITVDEAFRTVATVGDTLEVHCMSEELARDVCFDDGTHAGSCDGLATVANRKYYQHTFDPRLPIPAWVAGRTLYDYDGWQAGRSAGPITTP